MSMQTTHAVCPSQLTPAVPSHGVQMCDFKIALCVSQATSPKDTLQQPCYYTHSMQSPVMTRLFVLFNI